MIEKDITLSSKLMEANEVTVEYSAGMEARILWSSFCFRKRCWKTELLL